MSGDQKEDPSGYLGMGTRRIRLNGKIQVCDTPMTSWRNRAERDAAEADLHTREREIKDSSRGSETKNASARE